MKIQEIIEDINSLMPTPIWENTCDRVLFGDSDRDITGIGVTMFATPDVIRQAAAKGYNFLIVHEPLCYVHMDDHVKYAIGYEKLKLLEETGLTVYRYHDHAHSTDPDYIYDGQITFMGLAGTRVKGKYFAVNRYILDEEMTAAELAAALEKSYGIQHIRIAGCTDKKGKAISCCFGTPGHVIDELMETDFVLAGEICEWAEGEAARDYAQLGYNKAILVMGHIGSEREGMRLLANNLAKKYTDIPISYLECGEVYSYTK